jgi:hypothetical protein
MRQRLLVIACVAVWLMPGLNAQQNEVSLGRFDTELLKSLPDRTPVLLPAWKGSLEQGMQLQRSLGFTLQNLAPEQNLLGQIRANADKDPNLIYRQRFPWPEVEPDFVRRTSYGEAIAGIVHPPSGITAYRRSFRWRFAGARSIKDLEQKVEVVWHWLPPEKWGIENPVSETGRLNDRYRGAILRARKEGREGWRYAVVSFDAVSGERWLTPLPVWEALERLQSLTGKQVVSIWEKADTAGPGRSSMLTFSFSVTRDGSRTLVLVGNPEDTAHCLLFVLDGEGVLLRTRVLPHMSAGIRRDYAESVFLLSLREQSVILPSQTGQVSDKSWVFLLNSEGEVLGRFAERADEARAPSVSLYSDEIAWHTGHWGAYWRLPRGQRGL